MAENNSLEVLLVLDLKNATEEQKSSFFENLKQNDWEPVPEVNGAWSASFEEMNREDVVDEVDGDLDEAAEASGVGSYAAALQFSENQAWVLEG